MAKKYEELKFTDDFMFCKILEQDKKLCVELLELILDRKVGKLVDVNRQKPIKITANGKGVRFDVYAEDGKTVYDIEMQNARAGSLPKRARYSRSMIDLNLIDHGADYRELNPSFVIYICQFRLFPGSGRQKYTFRTLCTEDTSIELGDDAAIVFLCSVGEEEHLSAKLKSFLTYVADGTPCDEFTSKLEHEVTKAKEHKMWRLEYMTLLEHYERERSEGREEGRREGREEGRAEGRAEGQYMKLIQLIRRKLEKGKTPDVIAEELEEEFSVVCMMCNAIQSNPDMDDEAVYQSLKENL